MEYTGLCELPRGLTLNQFIELLGKYKADYGHLPIQLTAAYAATGDVISLSAGQEPSTTWVDAPAYFWLNTDIMTG